MLCNKKCWILKDQEDLNKWQASKNNIISTARAGAKRFWNFSFYIAKDMNGKTIIKITAIMKWIGIYSNGVFPNMTPYRMKLSIMFRMFKIRNITPAKFMNPLNFWVGDYPLKIEICFTILGIKARQLLYFLCLSILSLIPAIVDFDALIVANGIWKYSPVFFTGGMK